MEELAQGVCLVGTDRKSCGQSAGQATRVLLGDGDHWPKERGPPGRLILSPAVGQVLEPGPMDSERELRTGTDRCVLGQRYRIVGPGAVDGGRRTHHEVSDPRLVSGHQEPLGQGQ